MREKGLQWAWDKGLITGIDAYSKLPIQLINRGTWNKHEPGPDFRNACIKLADITWYGDIEIHIHASDWRKHNHHLDTIYANVILHVVAENDLPLRVKGEFIPTLIIPRHVIKHLSMWQKKATDKLPCGHVRHSFSPEFIHTHWRNRVIRKQQEYATEKELTAYFLGKMASVDPQKRSGRQRATRHMKTAHVEIKNALCNQNHSLLSIQLEHLEKTMKKYLTHFETQNILLNGVIPFFWSELNENALSAFVKNLPAEKNRITRLFQSISSTPKNAYETQALLEINRQLCNHHQCLRCELGIKMFAR